MFYWKATLIGTAIFLLGIAPDAAAAETPCPNASLLYYNDLRMIDPNFRCRIGDVEFGAFGGGGNDGPPDQIEIRPVSFLGGWHGFQVFPVGLSAGTFTGDWLTLSFQWTTFAPTDAMWVADASLSAYTIHPGTYAAAQVQIGSDPSGCSEFLQPAPGAFIRTESASGEPPSFSSRSEVALATTAVRSFCTRMEVTAWDETLDRPGIAGGAGIGSATFLVHVVPEPDAPLLMAVAVLSMLPLAIRGRRARSAGPSKSTADRAFTICRWEPRRA